MSDWVVDEEEGGKSVAEMKEAEYYGGGAGGALQFDAVQEVFGNGCGGGEGALSGVGGGDEERRACASCLLVCGREEARGVGDAEEEGEDEIGVDVTFMTYVSSSAQGCYRVTPGGWVPSTPKIGY